MMKEVLEVMVMMVAALLESLSPGLNERFGIVTQCPEVMMMMVMLFLEKHKVEYQYWSQIFWCQ